MLSTANVLPIGNSTVVSTSHTYGLRLSAAFVAREIQKQRHGLQGGAIC